MAGLLFGRQVKASETEGNYSEAARILGITRTTLYKKAKECGLNVEKLNNH